MFMLDDGIIQEHMDYFLCQNPEVMHNSLLFDKSFCPESFTVADKLRGEKTLYFGELSYDEWCRGLIWDQIIKLPCDYDRDVLADITKNNVDKLVRYSVQGHELSEAIYNQEFVDIIRRVMYYTCNGNCKSDFYISRSFNELAAGIMPHLLRLIMDRHYDLCLLYKISVACGLVGLDMKGAPAASSNYANAGIQMSRFWLFDNMEEAAEILLNELEEVAQNSDTPVFYWKEFTKSLENAKKVVWMTDDYIESYLDLYFIQLLLKANYNLTIEIIPKNGRFGNDISWMDLEEILQITIFSDLRNAKNTGRLIVSYMGPQMGAANLRKLSDSCVRSIWEADFLVTKGCRIHEMLQGGINKKMFSSYIITRELSEIVTGFDSSKTPILLLCANPGEYMFWGTKRKNLRTLTLENGKTIQVCCTTLRDHERRKGMNDIEAIAKEFNELSAILRTYDGNPAPIYREMRMLAAKAEEFVRESYALNHVQYGEVRNKLSNFDMASWNLLTAETKKYLGEDFGKINILDVGTGSGRDLRHGSKIGFVMTGCDTCEEFIADYHKQRDACSDKKEYENAYVYGDACNLPFSGQSFSIVRHNAVLVHIPIIGAGYGADLAVSEANRVLKVGGLYELSVKKGKGMVVSDTGEGLGKRVFQYYEKEDIELILAENGFEIVSMEEIHEKRPAAEIVWIICVAIKKESCRNAGDTELTRLKKH